MPVDAGSIKALGRGWEGIEQILDGADERLENSKEASKKQTENQRTIISAWKDFAATTEGEKALQDLCDKTLNSPIYLCNHGVPMDQVAMRGAFREGQNDMVRSILTLIQSRDD